MHHASYCRGYFPLVLQFTAGLRQLRPAPASRLLHGLSPGRIKLPAHAITLLFGLALLSLPLTAAPGTTEPSYEIAFASFSPLNSDVFIAEADGSNARPLLPHPASDYNASFSHDGQWILFTSERKGDADIYRVHADGTELERLTDDPAFDDQAALSPDGELLAFVSSRTGQADIWICELRTKKLRNLTNHPAGDFRPAWSPDGKWIAFSTDRDSKKARDPAGFGTVHSTQIYVMRADGSEARRVTGALDFAGSPAWSPDGQQLAYYTTDAAELNKILTARRLRGTTQIAIIDLAMQQQRLLTSSPGEKWSPQWLSKDQIGYTSGGPEGGMESTAGPAGARGEFCCPQRSPDGRWLVFHRNVENQWPPLVQWPSRDPRFRLMRTGVFPSYAPSGERLICNDQRAGILHNSILTMKLDGSARTVLFTDAEKSALAPTYSPTGDRIAFGLGQFFQNYRGPVIADIAVMQNDGSNVKLLTDGTGNNGFPSWSPDGRRLVYRASNQSKRGLFVVTLETGEITALTPSPSHDNFPAWSPKGDRIAFTRDADGNFDIYTVKPDGSDLQRLTNAPGNDAHCAWSPDGEWIAFTSAREGFKDESALHPYNPQPYGEIYVMRADGSEAHALTDNAYEEGTVTWAPQPTVAKK